MIRIWGPAVLVAALLTGCGGNEAGDSKDGTTKNTGNTGGATTIGDDGSPCPLPVTFKLPDGWKAQSVDGGFAVADVDLACELDAKPAGMVGFIRVFTGGGGKPSEDVLKAFVAKYKGAGQGDSAEKYSAAKIGGTDGTQVAYVNNSVDGTSKKEAAFAVTAGTSAVVVHVGGIDTEEHEKLLPGFTLVRDSLATR